ncbi:phospholipase D-like domain-containing protein [Dyadobacter chenhuakuii]|uniref:phospholipase D n=1 Tax=Dyadobacter chenhuakuii TaxID=2909339 RepID=A0ABY4XLX6_9BACT|nr:phospholipase D-like domain-containing protein [Dyadobacter chenhuakuii]MCF2494268.1 phospholipase D-like domain-containing protein [Dyadobacter chenhuakuii]USJ31393.1 phospholipase D-like domain-containing protein [Dyadobacter chenhuakuii]
MTEVYFKDIYLQIINQIDLSNRSLKICVAWFTDIDIYQSILRAQNRGVEVIIIIARHDFNKNSRVDFKELLMNNGYVGYIGDINQGAKDSLMHNKFCIIDNCVLITGSYNWTFKARINDENIVIIKGQPEVIAKFNAKFESINPRYGFGIKENQVKLLPIESIMVKWEKLAGNEKDDKANSKLKSIYNKF